MPIFLLDTSDTTLPDMWQVVTDQKETVTFPCIDDALGAIKTMFEKGAVKSVELRVGMKV